MVTLPQEITSILLRKINIWQEFDGWECVFVSLNASGAIIKLYASLLGNTKQRNPKQLTLEILPSVIMKNKWGTVTVIESRGTQRRTLINTTKKRDRRDQRVFFFCPNPIILCHEVKALGIVVFFSSFEVKESWGVSVRTPKKALPPFFRWVEAVLLLCVFVVWFPLIQSSSHHQWGLAEKRGKRLTQPRMEVHFRKSYLHTHIYLILP